MMRIATYQADVRWILVWWLVHSMTKGDLAITLLPSNEEWVDQYSSLKLTCSFTEKNAKLLTWSKNKREVVGLSLDPSAYCRVFSGNVSDSEYQYSCDEVTFTILNVTNKMHQDKWHCGMSTGSVWSFSTTTTIHVKVKVTKVQLKLNGKDVTEQSVKVVAGKQETFLCIAGFCRPEAQIDWYINSSLVESSSDNFVLNASNKEHGNIIHCEAYNSQQDDERVSSVKPSLFVQVPVTMVKLKQNHSTITVDTLYVRESTVMTLTCEAGFSRPSATIDWYIGSIMESSNSSTFSFIANESLHNKTVYCRAYSFIKTTFVVSNKPVLYVQVKVTKVELKQNGNLVTWKNLTVTAGISLNLSCAYTPAYSRPPPIVEWYIKHGQIPMIESNSTMWIFYPRNADHGKTIYCKAYNLDSSEAVNSSEKRLYVRVEAVSSSILNSSDGGITLLAGKSYIIQCKSSLTRPAASITWTLGGVTLVANKTEVEESNDGLVSVISSASFVVNKSLDNSKLRCISSISTQTSPPTGVVELTVYWPPSIPVVVPKAPFPWLEGRSESLMCNSKDRGNPNATVDWQGVNGTREGHDQLIVSGLSERHDKLSVKCKMENEFTRIEKQTVISTAVFLEVQYTPHIKITVGNETPSTTYIDEGKALEALCTATGNPKPSVRWLETNNLDRYLYFSDIDRTVTGNYTCQATASSSVHVGYRFIAVALLEIIVRYPPNVTVQPAQGSVTENTSLDITCTPRGEPDAYEYLGWMHTWGPMNLSSSSRLYSPNILNIFSLQLQDSGNYTCLVSNGIKDRQGNLYQSGTTEIFVQVAPKVFTSTKTYTGEAEKSVTVQISFYAHPSPTAITFWMNGSAIENSTKYTTVSGEAFITTTFYGSDVNIKGHNINFTIMDLQEADFTDYDAVFKNDIGQTVFTFQLVPESQPVQPKYFKFLGDRNSALLFIWKQGFNGGHAQTFVIQVLKNGQTDWLNKTIVTEYLDEERRRNGSYIGKLTGLEPGSYVVRLVARNKIGEAAPLHLNSSIIVHFQEKPTGSFPIGAVVGGTMGGVAFLSTVIIILVIRKRRSKLGDDESKKTFLNSKRNPKTKEQEEKAEINLNPMYESSDAVQLPKPDRDDNTGVNKKSYLSNPETASATYSVVTKAPNKDSKSKSNACEISDVYSTPIKKEKGKDNKKKKRDAKKKQQKNEQSDGSIYENAETTCSKLKGAGNDYENPVCGAIDEKPCRTKNEDGLIYVQVELPQLKNAQNKRPVIHGEDRTIYADVAFGQVGERMPESDDEEK